MAGRRDHHRKSTRDPAPHTPAPAQGELFLTAPPGLEDALRDEAAALGFAAPQVVPGGVLVTGCLAQAMRANLLLRGAGRVLLRVAAFRALHLAQLDKRARRVPWEEFLRPDTPVRIEATCQRSRVYHEGAAVQRVAGAIADRVGAPQDPEAPLRVMVRIEDDLCTLSIDTSGAPLHRRGTKLAVGKAPLRETLAALFLRQCGYDGQEPVVDPMCGSGTIVIEAAAIAAGLPPGGVRSFAFEGLAGFDPRAWEALRAQHSAAAQTALRFHGADRDAGAVAMAQDNAARAGVGDFCSFQQAPVSALMPPPGPSGLVMVNPPYGARIGARHMLHAVYGALGQTLRARFAGWRVGVVTSDGGLAASTGLPFGPPGPPVPHGPLKIRLYQTGPLRGG
ncbi:class I SAM-dependent RNA methyltransferase [Rhodobacteraceae bacterium 2376]|uniref:Class I SAM-dependent RNA methyltransferase n=1 Tax=Rhabdonatronobacter sediminivivens TaxID=2743469 RepID=A0A7Z0KZA5_9RHOB|nr:class I SAM-dependent RNA methyltransferase [Rhabdonatronobacter sediminivivens]